MPRPTYQPSDRVIGADVELQNASLLDFWKWAFSDLCDDDLKGIFAEWLVLKLLGIPAVRRVSWANSDIITLEGVRIEIKSTSYWQSWKLIDEVGSVRPMPLHPVSRKTKVRFAGLKARDAVMAPANTEPQILKSHIYVFAFQHEKDFDQWNAMDLSQWEFYVLPVSRMRELRGRSVSLLTLRAEQKGLCDHEVLTPNLFADVARTLIHDAANNLQLRVHQA
jgi:hypothetical protein